MTLKVSSQDMKLRCKEQRQKPVVQSVQSSVKPCIENENN